MMKRRISKVIAFVVALVLMSTSFIFAQETTLSGENEQMRLENTMKCLNGEEHDHTLCMEGYGELIPCESCINSDVIMTTKTCVCGENMGQICAQDAIEYDRGTHKYNLGKKTCTVAYLRSRTKWYCSTCHRTAWVYNDAGTFIPYHDCWQVHQNCSLGNYHVCPINF